MARRAVLWLACLSLWGVAGIASAQQPTAAAVPPPTASQADDDVARGLFQAGKSAYEAGNYT